MLFCRLYKRGYNNIYTDQLKGSKGIELRLSICYVSLLYLKYFSYIYINIYERYFLPKLFINTEQRYVFDNTVILCKKYC